MSAYRDWHVGMKVVCVDTWTRQHGAGDEVGPISGKVYTLREIGILDPVEDPDVVCVRLVEIVNVRRPYRGYPQGYEVVFGAFRFRPVQTRKTSIAVFHALLTPARVRENA